ncbi:hypothetical protein SG34_032660 [Thalassomonas viridans]|uniref:Uncharacterized protein n=1 Tax=Thalassomonas viridans TaxID=137584 RepID=A0AAF0CCT1_9GAMM|nr:hypothetical protein [Thalassomonas viridans]WDE08668.1 hypothetical protein SG34_032660 [Thalassomonas viridans]
MPENPFEQKDMEALIALKYLPAFSMKFDTKVIQRELKITYSRAKCLQEAAIASGLLIRDQHFDNVTHFHIRGIGRSS